jgi:tetratricopeptide (TPR) repeat protein
MVPSVSGASSSVLSTAELETAVARIDAQLALDSTCLALSIDRGQLLEMLGRKDEAVAAYITVLRVEPTHPQALNALGLLTLAAGNRDAARTLLSGAVLHGPTFAPAHANLAYVRMGDNHLTGARALYDEALRLDPELAIAHHGLAELLPRLGDEPGAAHHRALGLRYRPITIERYTGDGRPVRILALGTAAVGNVPTDGYFDSSIFALASLTVEYADPDPDVPLPPHDIVFNAIGEADLCAAQLTKAAAITRRTTAPILNDPRAVAATGRAANARRLGCLAGIVTARIVPFARAALTAPCAPAVLAEADFRFPLLVRSPGYHTGDHFVKVERADDLRAAVEMLPGDEVLVIDYLDLRDARGDVRKFRAIIVDGKLHPLHLAISRSWKVHYFSADMAEHPKNRAEDAAFLSDMAGVLGARAMAALERVRETLALDYGGIDFTIDGNGDVVVFEANASMIVPSPQADAIWDYRRAAVARIRAAVRDMLVRRAAPISVEPLDRRSTDEFGAEARSYRHHHP